MLSFITMAEPPPPPPPTGHAPRTTLAAFYEAVMKQRGFGLARHHRAICAGLQDTRIPNLMIIGPPGLGKALHPATPIPVPGGKFTPMGELRPGDLVLHTSGTPIRVLARQEQPESQLWRIKFNDGRTIVAHGKHLWSINHKELPDMHGNVLMTTDQIRAKFNRNSKLSMFVPLCEPTENPEAVLPIPPYLFGVILGDGSTSPTGFVRVSNSSPEVIARFTADAASIGSIVTEGARKHAGGSHWNIRGLGRRIAAMGLTDSRSDTKYIPEVYFAGSVEQRFALLQGLMDTDGYAQEGGRGEYSTASLILADNVRRLVWSLGGKATHIVRETHYTKNGVRYPCKLSFRMNIALRDAHRLFSLPRKLTKACDSTLRWDHKLKIVGVEPAVIAPSVCIQVDAQDGMFLAGDYVPTHNSSLFGIVYPAYRLGEQPETTILGLSGGEKLITTFMHAVAELIEHSPVFVKLYGDRVRPDKKAGWSSDRGLFVTGRPLGDQDASYFASGLKSKALTGVHARELILDDLHDEENSATPELRQAVIDKYYRTILGRGDPRGARYIMTGRRWAVDDLYGMQIRSGDWTVMHIPAQRRDKSNKLWTDIAVPVDEATKKPIPCCFSEDYPLAPDEEQTDPRFVKYRAYYGADATGAGFYWPEMVSKRREYFQILAAQPNVAETVYNGNPKGGDDDIFVESDFTPYLAPGELSAALADRDVLAFCRQPGVKVVQAWDTATGQNQSSAFTVSITAALVPCKHWHRGEDEGLVGPCAFHYDVYLLALTRNRHDYAALVKGVRAESGRWNARPVLIEDKSSGISLLQTLRSSDVPVKGIKVVEGKVARAVNGVGGGPLSVQGWGRMGRIFVPEGEPWLKDFLAEVLAFSGDSRGRADQFDALVHLVSYAIQISSKSALVPESNSMSADVNPAMFQRAEMGRELVEQANFLAMPANSPYAGLCGAPCVSYALGNSEWCSFHKRKTSAIHGCSDWSATRRPER